MATTRLSGPTSTAPSDTSGGASAPLAPDSDVWVWGESQVIFRALTAARAVRLPDPSGRNQEVLIADGGGTAATYNITVYPNNGGTISGVTSKVISTNYGYLRVVPAGTEWVVVG
jgi:hypothetical protein